MNSTELEKCEELVRSVVGAIYQVRTGISMSRNELSQRSGLSNSAIQRIEESQRQPTLLSLFRISRSLNIDLWRLVKEAERIVKSQENK